MENILNIFVCLEVNIKKSVLYTSPKQYIIFTIKKSDRIFFSSEQSVKQKEIMSVF